MSLVNKDVLSENTVMGGVPALFLKTARHWTEELPYNDEVERCERLKRKIGLANLL